MMNNYWVNYWKEYTKGSCDLDKQSQVLRTENKMPIKESLWEFTLAKIDAVISPAIEDDVLDLCCGNGLISMHLSSKVKHIVAVDVSPQLIGYIDTNEYSNIEATVSDIRNCSYKDHSFDKVILYAGIQYLTDSEAVKLVEGIYRWLKPGGVLFIGDIPNRKKVWCFYNTLDRESVYFNNLKESKDVVGTWFDKEFFAKLGRWVGFHEYDVIIQDEKLIYSGYRYDFRMVKS